MPLTYHSRKPCQANGNLLVSQNPDNKKKGKGPLSSYQKQRLGSEDREDFEWDENLLAAMIAAEGFSDVTPFGSGGFGIVFSARDSRLKRTVAIKILKGPEGFFLTEGAAMAAINSKHVVEVFHSGKIQYQGRAIDYLVMEFVKGGTLAELISADGPVPIDKAIELFKQIAIGLEAAHEKGVIHCDLKPANIFIKNHPNTLNAKIGDFGLSYLTEFESKGLSEDYAPPEQKGHRNLKPTIDIYAFGVVMFETLTGMLPTEFDEQAIPCFETRAFLEIADKCMATAPLDRYQSVDKVMAAISEFQRPKVSRSRWKVAMYPLFGITLAAGLISSILYFTNFHPAKARDPNKSFSEIERETEVQQNSQEFLQSFVSSVDRLCQQWNDMDHLKNIQQPQLESFLEREKWADMKFEVWKNQPRFVESYIDLKIVLSRIFQKTGDFEQALSKNRRAAEVLGQTADDASLQQLHDLGVINLDLGKLFFQQPNRISDAIDRSMSAHHWFMRAVKRNDASDADRANVGLAALNVAIMYETIHEPQNAIEWYEKALRANKDMGKKAYLEDIALIYVNIGGLFYFSGEINSASQWFQESIKIRRQLFKKDVENQQRKFDYAFALFHKSLLVFGNEFARTGERFNLSAEIEGLKLAHQLLSELAEDNPSVVDYQLQLLKIDASLLVINLEKLANVGSLLPDNHKEMMRALETRFEQTDLNAELKEAMTGLWLAYGKETNSKVHIERATEELKRLLKTYPANAEFQFQLGQMIQSSHSTLEDLEFALGHFKGGFKQAPTVYRYYWGYRQCLTVAIEFCREKGLHSKAKEFRQLVDELSDEPARLILKDDE